MKKAKWIGRTLGLISTAAVLSGLGGSVVHAQDTPQQKISPASEMAADKYGLEPTYRSAASDYRHAAYTGDAVVFAAASIAADGSRIETAKNYDIEAVRLKQGETTEFTVTVPVDGLYRVGFEYYDDTDTILPVKVALAVDGAFPFYEMRNQLFASRWTYGNADFQKDRYGNEVVPESKKVQQWQTKMLRDASGMVSDDLLLELSAGKHVWTLSCEQSEMLIGKVALLPVETDSFNEEGEPQGAGLYILPGEKPTYKSDSTIRPGGEYNPDLRPYQAGNTVMNMLDGNSFSAGEQRVTYSFTVEQDGYYAIGIRYRQDAKANFPVYRDIYIDDKIQSPSYAVVPFDYTTKFQNKEVRNKQTDRLAGVWLTAGETHTISLQVNLESLASVAQTVKNLVENVQALSLDITKMTGNNTEKYRDFDLNDYMPGIGDTLTGWADKVRDIYAELQAMARTDKKIGEFSTLPVCEKQLRSMAKRPDELPGRLNELAQGQNSIAQYLADVLERLYYSPLAIDEIYVYQSEAVLPKNTNFFVRIWESVKRFFLSFGAKAYDKTAADNTENLQVWVARSRQYVEIIQKMADEKFASGTGVDISLMPDPGKLVLANAAGDSPDVALGVNYALPYELALRGALKDLHTFPDISEVEARFKPGLVYPGRYNGGLFALPETTNFLVLFYRTDILNNLNLTVPDTMQEVKNMLPQLNRQGMNFFTHMAGNIGYKPFSATLPFIYQNGGSLYGNTADDIRLNSEATIDALTEMTELFTIYGMPFEVRNFYQHFRSGLLPIGVSDFNTYNLLLNTAPEIANSWDIALYPGYKDEKGEVQRWTTGAAESCMIFESTEKPDFAWEFLKWWTAEDTQLRFAQTLQLTYGKEYMWNTSNVEAFKRLPWNKRHKEVILEQLNWVVEAPRVPGNYMMERELSNTVMSVVLDGKNPRAAINESMRTVRSEIWRKLEEFGYMKNGEIVREYVIPPIT